MPYIMMTKANSLLGGSIVPPGNEAVTLASSLALSL